MLKDSRVQDALFKSGVILSKFKKYETLSKWYNLPNQEEAIKENLTQNQQEQYNQQARNVINALKNADPTSVADYKTKNPTAWKYLEQHSPEDMKQISSRVFTPRQTQPETDTTDTDSSNTSFQSPNQSNPTPQNPTPQNPTPQTGKGIPHDYKRLVVLLGAAKTGIKDENRDEFTKILDKLMGKRLMDKRARELLLSRFNKN